jgi:sugar lactone lactonase YvrE
MSVNVMIDADARLGEGPRWDANAKRLLWVDIERRLLHLFDPAEGTDRSIELDNRPGAAVPMSDGRVLVALADRLVALDPADESCETLAVLPHEADMRMNDGACDPAGRFWIGSLELEFAEFRGTLYRYDGELVPVVHDVTLSNGIGWSPDGTLMYYADTLTYAVDVFDFDVAEGTLANRRRFAVIERGVGVPDGLAVDDEGCVWVALYGGSAVRRYDAAGRIERVVPVPAKNVTSCGFGGDAGDQLFITSAAPDGRVFVHEPGVTGPPAQPFRSTAPSAADPTSAA